MNRELLLKWLRTACWGPRGSGLMAGTTSVACRDMNGASEKGHSAS